MPWLCKGSRVGAVYDPSQFLLAANLFDWVPSTPREGQAEMIVWYECCMFSIWSFLAAKQVAILPESVPKLAMLRRSCRFGGPENTVLGSEIRIKTWVTSLPTHPAAGAAKASPASSSSRRSWIDVFSFSFVFLLHCHCSVSVLVPFYRRYFRFCRLIFGCFIYFLFLSLSYVCFDFACYRFSSLSVVSFLFLICGLICCVCCLHFMMCECCLFFSSLFFWQSDDETGNVSPNISPNCGASELDIQSHQV